ncbi:MAG TPA: DUF3047 domain-containing protein [Burkholderiales bacterium]|nr:DUF3047 domain-containing protein [Burkholderiales bacterium]
MMIARRYQGTLWIRAALAALGLMALIPAIAKEPLLVADPAATLAGAWTHQAFGTATEYKGIVFDGVAAIRAVGRFSASGLYRDFRFEIEEHPWIEWTWRVERLQRTADIRVKAREDYAAAIFLIFGRPSMLNRDVPTLAYVWTSARIPEGSIIDSPYHPGTTRSVVVRSGEKQLGRWLRERRNVVDDFRRAFGREPPATVEVIALFTDNDQTREPVETYYGAVWALPR